MRLRLRIITFVTFATGIAAFGVAGAEASSASRMIQADSVAVANVVKDFHNALSKGDSARALTLLADDAVILESGYFERRSEYRSQHLAEDIKFAKAVASKRGPLQVIVESTTAWTAVTSTSKGRFKGKAIDSFGAESMVLTKGTMGWRIRAIHWSSHKRPGAT